MKGAVAVVAASNRRHSNSAAIARYLSGALANAGVPVRTVDVAEQGGLADNLAPAIDLVSGCRHVVLVASLYHDTLNYMATATLEKWAEHPPARPNGGPVAFSAVVHSGYPEPAHTAVALDICHRFADEVGWHWKGGLTAGATSAIGGRNLGAGGPMTKNLRRALEGTARAIAEGEPVPEEAARIAARTALPTWLFIPLANWMMRREARRLGTRDIDAQPYR